MQELRRAYEMQSVDTENPEIALSGVIEIIPCSQAAEESIRGY